MHMQGACQCTHGHGRRTCKSHGVGLILRNGGQRAGLSHMRSSCHMLCTCEAYALHMGGSCDMSGAHVGLTRCACGTCVTCQCTTGGVCAHVGLMWSTYFSVAHHKSACGAGMMRVFGLCHLCVHEGRAGTHVALVVCTHWCRNYVTRVHAERAVQAQMWGPCGLYT